MTPPGEGSVSENDVDLVEQLGPVHLESPYRGRADVERVRRVLLGVRRL